MDGIFTDKESKLLLEIMSLDRHFIWADQFKQLHYEHLHEMEKIKADDFANAIGIFIKPAGIYMCYWYASLYTVLEGLSEMKIVFPEIESDIADIKMPLRLFRNVIYHHQAKYMDNRMFVIMENKDSRAKIKRVHEFLNRELPKIMQAQSVKMHEEFGKSSKQNL